MEWTKIKRAIYSTFCLFSYVKGYSNCVWSNILAELNLIHCSILIPYVTLDKLSKCFGFHTCMNGEDACSCILWWDTELLLLLPWPKDLRLLSVFVAYKGNQKKALEILISTFFLTDKKTYEVDFCALPYALLPIVIY